MIKLRKALRSYLITICPRVYFQDAPIDAAYPYLVYDIPNSFDDGVEIVTVDIDGWDIPVNGDSTAIETLMSAVNGNGDILNPSGLNRRTLIGDNFVASFYIENKIPVRDDDKKIIRRKYTYTARYIKENE